MSVHLPGGHVAGQVSTTFAMGFQLGDDDMLASSDDICWVAWDIIIDVDVLFFTLLLIFIRIRIRIRIRVRNFSSCGRLYMVLAVGVQDTGKRGQRDRWHKD